MEAAPPSYDYATSRNHWSLIAPYIRSEDLKSACQVSKSWHRSFAPQLWGNPSLHFMHLFSDPWLGLRKFERIIHAVARPEVRQLTHTLQVPVDTESLYEEIYSSKWLFNILSRLPRLQCLLVPYVSSFDHEALTTLQRSILPNYEQSEASNHESVLPSNHMRLLDASSCRNVTAAGLLIAFDMFPSLMYLDLSGVPAASFAEVPGRLHRLRDLKVLNLRRVRLTDAMLTVLATGIGRRVRCLDIRENPTTEKGLLALLDASFLTELEESASHQDPNQLPSEEPPSYEKKHSATTIQGQDFAGSLFKALTQGHVNRLALENSSEIGVTHLRMSMKSINARSLFASFNCQNLQFLDIDCGAVEFGRQPNILHASPERLECLRIHHSLITGGETRPLGSTDIEIPKSLRDVLERRSNRAQDGRTNCRNIVASLPSLRALFLTDIPAESTSSMVPSRIIELLRNCAINENLANIQARLENMETNSHGIQLAEARRAKTLFPLEKIVLELTPKKPVTRNQLSKDWNYREDTKAVTGDKDSEALWAAATTDFSFFRGDDRNVEPDVRLESIKAREMDKRKAERSLLTFEDPYSMSASQSTIDVITEIISYRKESRRKFESTIGRGESNDIFHEYWTGVVSLVRT